MKNRVEELGRFIAQLASLDDDDIPLGKDVARRDAIVEAAVEAADDIIMAYTDGSVEETNYLTGEVALKLTEKTVIPLRSAILRKTLESRDPKLSVKDWQKIPREQGTFQCIRCQSTDIRKNPENCLDWGCANCGQHTPCVSIYFKQLTGDQP